MTRLGHWWYGFGGDSVAENLNRLHHYKGWLGTKRKVTCGYCGTESRLDNLRRHINTIHGKDVEMKFNAIEPKESVKSFFF